MIRRLMVVALSAMTLTGCMWNFNSQPEDYTGADAARIRSRVAGNTSIKIYEKQGDCYKQISQRRLTAAFSLMGFPVSGGNSVGMPESSSYKGHYTSEFRIKPGQLLRVMHYSSRIDSESFIPQPNHDYDVIITGSLYAGDSVSVRDLDQNAKLVPWPEGKDCPKGLFD